MFSLQKFGCKTDYWIKMYLCSLKKKKKALFFNNKKKRRGRIPLIWQHMQTLLRLLSYDKNAVLDYMFKRLNCGSEACDKYWAVVKIGTVAPEPGFWAVQPDSPWAVSVGPAGPGHGLPVVIAAESPCWGSVWWWKVEPLRFCVLLKKIKRNQTSTDHQQLVWWYTTVSGTIL